VSITDGIAPGSRALAGLIAASVVDRSRIGGRMSE
jgi:hypothetical protein